jgi:hypothetical protein
MPKLFLLVSLICILLIISSFSVLKCTASNSPTESFKKVTNDSTELQGLVVKLLKWHQTDTTLDFEPFTYNSKDSIYRGIDWKLYNKRVGELKKENLFSKDFFETYQKIAAHLDKELKENKVKYYVGELPPYDHSNEWCNCQDYPTNIWKRLYITNLKINGDITTFQWTWDSKFFYTVKAKKENSSWRITALQGFTIKNFAW